MKEFDALFRLAYITPEISTVLLVLLLVLLFVSFCASGAEIAYFSLTYKDINVIKTRQQPGYRRIISLLEHPKQLMGSLQVANSFSNIGIVVIGSHIMGQVIQLENPWLLFLLKAVVLIVVILLFGEVLPKTLAAQNNIRFAKDTGWITEGLYLLFNRLALGYVTLSDKLEKVLGQRSTAASIEELTHAIDLTAENEATAAEKNILKGILKFGNITVKQVMRARLDVHGLNVDMNFEEVKSRVEELHYSRLPVYKESLDTIRGVVHTKDLLPALHQEPSYNWQQHMRPAYFVHEQKLIEDLMQEFQQKRIHFAVVVDEFGGTSGIITMEDILEEIMGEIKDEFDEEENFNGRIDDLNYMFEGKTMLNDLCRVMGLPAEYFNNVRGESDSIAGLVLEVAGEIPEANRVITINEFDFTIVEVSRNRITRIRVTIKSSSE